jgi:hypothetical protein
VRFLNYIGYDWSKTRTFPAEYEEFDDSVGYAVTIPTHLLGHNPISRAKRALATRKQNEKEAPEGTS